LAYSHVIIAQILLGEGMKKLMTFLVLAGIILGFTGCESAEERAERKGLEYEIKRVKAEIEELENRKPTEENIEVGKIEQRQMFRIHGKQFDDSDFDMEAFEKKFNKDKEVKINALKRYKTRLEQDLKDL
jgi:hypothetical protein